MANTLKYGSTGSDVKTLQNKLNSVGYTLDEDGVYGIRTQEAVRDYQGKNGLAVDGTAGDALWQRIDQSGTSTPGNGYTDSYSPSTTADWLASYEKVKPVYNQSNELTRAADELAAHEQQRPGEYQSVYGDQIQGLLDKILNREKFTYDANADPLYRQYAEDYQRKGQMAMQDAMGSAAALTGGYGNSYAQTAGQQAYQGYMQDMAGMMPELQQAAYSMYNTEGDRMNQNLSTLQGQEQTAYGQYQDKLTQYNNELNYLYGKHSDMSAAEYNRYLNDVNAWEQDRAYWYQKEQDRIAQENWQKEYELALAKLKGTGGGGGKRGSGDDDKNKFTNIGVLGAVVGAAGTNYDKTGKYTGLLPYYGTQNTSFFNKYKK